MRVSVTERPGPSAADMRPAGELAPSLALPWIVKLRYGVLAGQTVLILLTHFVLGVSLLIQWLAVPLALTAVTNLLAYRFAGKVGDRRALGHLLTFDVIGLTAILALTGGPANPLSLLYLVQITLSAVVLNKAWTWSLGLLSMLGFGSLFWVHVRVSVFEGHHASDGFSIHLAGMWIAFVAAALLVTVFIGKVSEALRRREQEVLQLQELLARHQRVASIATLAAGAAHELGTPLGTIAVAARDIELTAEQVTADPELARDARLIRREVERCRSIVERLSAPGQPGELPVRVGVPALLEQMCGDFAPPARERIRLLLKGDEDSVVLPVAAARQALSALVRNALDASGGGQITVSARRRAGSLEFAVEDSGSGMSSDTLDRIAEPFFTTKAPGCGMGLGTYLVRVFAEQLGGRLAFESELGRGTTALLEVPLDSNAG